MIDFLCPKTKTIHSASRPNKMAPLHLLTLFFFVFSSSVSQISATLRPIACRSFCGNITVDYPFSLRHGCGHPAFRDLLFCVNDFPMLHITSGSYRVLDIDYAYNSLTLHDRHMSDCDSIFLQAKGNGFVTESWRAPYLYPTPDNVFILIGCSARSSPLFHGFLRTGLPCQTVSGMGCEEYYQCRAWDSTGRRRVDLVRGPDPAECCAVGFDTVSDVNLTKLQCEGYSSAYNLAPVRHSDPGKWSYGIRVGYSLRGNEAF